MISYLVGVIKLNESTRIIKVKDIKYTNFF